MKTLVHSILMIDDDPDDYEMLKEAISEINPDIKVAYLNRCEDGLRFKDQKFDIIFLDINMPHHNGFDWLRGMTGQARQTLPVVMFTTSSNPLNIEKAYKEGAVLYFTKPESFNEMISGLQKILEMNWSDPQSVKAAQMKGGKYAALQ